ncbi:MAG: cupredoxin domain-containing protein [Acidimicrobiales bacterium]
MDRHPRLRPLFATFLVAVLALGLAACGDDDEPTASDQGTTASDASNDDPYGTPSSASDDTDAPEGTIVAKDFSLSDVTVAPGAKIVLDNQGGTKHTATGDDDEFDLEADGGSTSEPGTAPEEPGTYTFHCEIHSSMTATLTVKA